MATTTATTPTAAAAALGKGAMSAPSTPFADTGYVLTVQLNYLNSYTAFRLEKSSGMPPQFVDAVVDEGGNGEGSHGAKQCHGHNVRRLCHQCSKCRVSHGPVPYHRERCCNAKHSGRQTTRPHGNSNANHSKETTEQPAKVA